MKIKFALIAMLALIVFSGCSDDDEAPYTCSDCVDEPEALAANDGSGKGIYKGVIIGSTGTITINIDNAGNGHITALLVLDDDEIELTADVEYNEDGFNGCFVNANEGVSICFTVSPTGSVEVGDITIPGHPVIMIALFKEYSNQLVSGFEGTYTGGEGGGTFNMIMRQNTNGNGAWGVISRRTQSPHEEGLFTGEISDDELNGGGGEVDITGEKDGDVVKGEWTNGVISGTWTGKRTL
jgi:hypothetical protein